MEQKEIKVNHIDAKRPQLFPHAGEESRRSGSEESVQIH